MPKSFTSLELSAEDVLYDYKIALTSRLVSLRGRKEVLNGRAKFGIFGDGKELAQVAMARAVRGGDWRSGYYRDQTLMFAQGQSTVRQFFAQLYADTDPEREPASGGRQMNSHYSTRLIDANGASVDHLAQFNTSADISPTGGQMARLVGLAYASKLFRCVPAVQQWGEEHGFTQGGDEIAFGTIGNASTAEGLFWESLNAAGVLHVPFLISIWDDGYGISVPNDVQLTKGSIYELISGFAAQGSGPGYALFQSEGYDYEGLVEAYQQASRRCRKEHRPCAVHVRSMTQPQGHSTSGSHERYKSQDRLRFEEEFDCIVHMERWLLARDVVSESSLAELRSDIEQQVDADQEAAWAAYSQSLDGERDRLLAVYDVLTKQPEAEAIVTAARDQLQKVTVPLKKTVDQSATETLIRLSRLPGVQRDVLLDFVDALKTRRREEYNTHLFCREQRSPLQVQHAAPTVDEGAKKLDGRQVIQQYFDIKLANDPRIFIIGEDVGKLGGVNLEFEGLSERHGDFAVTDTGIREATILGQGIGAALRGLRPIVDIQYLDYLAYCIQGVTDDLATVSYRTAGGQVAPVIIRTKGHRLEGIWHTGSPMAMILGAVRGLHVCVPRNCVQAAGMYETLLAGDDPALVVEVLNGYRVKETVPRNLGHYTIPLGVPEVLNEGSDLTIITYGANCRVAQSALGLLKELDIQPELIDVQTLLPFDRPGVIAKSLEKTGALLVLDEDVPGGASAFMLQQVLECQRGYDFLDAPPRTLTAKEHRSAYGSDGDYYCKPTREDIVLLVHEMMRERYPQRYPTIT